MFRLPQRARQAGFSLAEIMVACGLFSIVAASSAAALLRANHNAALSRLKTGASTVAQNRIDLILSDGPFNPQKSQVPPALVAGTQMEGTSINPTIPIYTDPATGTVSVWGWMTTSVTNTNLSYSGQPLYLYQARVSVSYTFRGRSYTVTMNTARTADI